MLICFHLHRKWDLLSRSKISVHEHLPSLHPQYAYLVLISLVSISHGIRVHWNTNEGPIVPPTSTAPPVPKPPFREPAPVWEIQSNDIENPNKFVYVISDAINSQSDYHASSPPLISCRYVLPPPSRPKYNPDNVNDIYPTKNASPTNFGHHVPLHLPTSRPQGTLQQFPTHHNPLVSQLAVQYVANIGNRYYAIVPVATDSNPQYQFHNNLKPFFWKGGELLEKPFGKYNGKQKKYKAYETKQKFIPYITVSILPLFVCSY